MSYPLQLPWNFIYRCVFVFIFVCLFFSYSFSNYEHKTGKNGALLKDDSSNNFELGVNFLSWGCLVIPKVVIFAFSKNNFHFFFLEKSTKNIYFLSQNVLISIFYHNFYHRMFKQKSFESSFAHWWTQRQKATFLQNSFLLDLIFLYLLKPWRMDEYRFARRVLMAEVSEGRYEGDWGWAGWMVERWPWATEEWRCRLYVIVRKIRKSGEPWYICNWISFTPPFLLGPVFFRTTLACFGGYHLDRGEMPLHDAVGIN